MSLPENLRELLAPVPPPSAPIINIYCSRLTPRMAYVCRFIFKQVLQVNFLLTADTMEKSAAHLCYSESAAGKGIHIKPHGLIGESGITPRRPVPVKIGEDWCLFESESRDDAFGFDLFAAVFYMISRYEEWQDFERDEHGRFEARAGIFFKEGEQQVPWVDRWIGALAAELRSRFPYLALPSPRRICLSTMDVDNLYAFRSKGLTRTGGAIVKDLFGLKFTNLLERLRVLFFLMRDPFDIYEDISRYCSEKAIPLVCFFLYGGRTRFDRGIRPSRTVFRRVFRQLRDNGAFIGLHPSYATLERPEALNGELRKLEQHSGQKVQFARQHYLRFGIRHTPGMLSAAGIAADFTMGFASAPGFRAATTYPFWYYDFEREAPGELLMVPFCAMDGVYTVYSGETAGVAFRSIMRMAEETVRNGGYFITVFHERTFYDRLYPGYGHLYKKLHNAVSDLFGKGN